MMILAGESFYPRFKLTQRLKTLHDIIPFIKAVTLRAWYLVDVDTALTGDDAQRLLELLSADEQLEETTPSFSQPTLLVLPRFGTISPWSSKATDIAHVCGLTTIKRLERAFCYQIQLADGKKMSVDQLNLIKPTLFDPLIETVLTDPAALSEIFTATDRRRIKHIDILSGGKHSLEKANAELGLALSEDEIDYLLIQYKRLQRNPTDAELMMFAQVNSEHCRHKLFNASWTINDEDQPESLFGLIKKTHHKQSVGVLSAYDDNAAVIACDQEFSEDHAQQGGWFFPDSTTHHYGYHAEPTPMVIKVETHNHPTGISPFPGAATGAGGEIRDEGATGRGGCPKAGLTGFTVSNLHIPTFDQPWELDSGKPAYLASALQIMLEAPVGAAAFNNEFGRPNLCGYFRSYEMCFTGVSGVVARGYHKPIMIAGGYGHIRMKHVKKRPLTAGTKLLVLGGPAMLIGLGGGAASSQRAGTGDEDLDFASVQRCNPEMQRRCQQVINSCWALGEENPIISIHDVGAGGLSNALPELVHDSECGAVIALRDIPNAEPGMSPAHIWCNEAQERYVLALDEADLSSFTQIAARERCPFAVVGVATDDGRLVVTDAEADEKPVELPMSILFSDPPQLKKNLIRHPGFQGFFDLEQIDVDESIRRVLRLPSVADKSFLITIADRSVTGLVARDQMVGPWQVPVADVAVTAASYQGYAGEAMAMGERTPLSVLNYNAAARMAVGEAITNIAAASITQLHDIKLSANWMVAGRDEAEAVGLYDAVSAVSALCIALGICIPVGKDSTSMAVSWDESGVTETVLSPVSLIVTAFAPVNDIRKTLTPQLRKDCQETCLIFIDLEKGFHCLGGSALAQVYEEVGMDVPDVRDVHLLKRFFHFMQRSHQADLLLAYHDRSDGGLFVTLCEMAFAGRTGVTIQLENITHENPMLALFNEGLGAVVQLKEENKPNVLSLLEDLKLADYATEIGRLNDDHSVRFMLGEKEFIGKNRIVLQRFWSETSYHLQRLRDNPDCAEQQYDMILLHQDPGLRVDLTFDLKEDITAPYINLGVKPQVAILREQGVNGHVEMAAVFDRVGFTPVDVHMTDILQGRVDLAHMNGLVACGGFSYGDVLGAGRGWASAIRYHAKARKQFGDFFARETSFTLGVCNGCQMLAQLNDLIPGAEGWPLFARNQSEQFEARLSMVSIPQSPSIFFRDMAGSVLPVTVAHGEGRTVYPEGCTPDQLLQESRVCLQYIDYADQPTVQYPANPNGSEQGITAVCSLDGRVTLMMPHPERLFRTVQYSWHPDEWGEAAPWLRFFQNARLWLN